MALYGLYSFVGPCKVESFAKQHLINQHVHEVHMTLSDSSILNQSQDSPLLTSTCGYVLKNSVSSKI